MGEECTASRTPDAICADEDIRSRFGAIFKRQNDFGVFVCIGVPALKTNQSDQRSHPIQINYNYNDNQRPFSVSVLGEKTHVSEWEYEYETRRLLK